MFNKISNLNFNSNKITSNNISTTKISSEGSIFGENLIDNTNENIDFQKNDKQSDKTQKKAEKERIKAQKKAEKEKQKAEQEYIKNNPDGIIQGGKQGSNAGDCWLLSQMNSLAKTNWGKEALSKAITKNPDGDFTIHFKGVNKEINISNKEFTKAQNSSNYSSGDADALLLELAVEKYFKENDINSKSISGNRLAGASSLQNLLVGKKGVDTDKEMYYKPILTVMGQNPDNNANIAATYIYNENPHSSSTVNHAVSIQKVILNKKGEVDEIILLDSYSPQKTISKSYRQFVDELQSFGYTTPPAKKD